jgi:hypothetical protein
MRKLGIDGNRPLDDAGNISPTIQPDLVAETGTGYVRVNFVLGPYDSPRNADWQNRFDSLIDGLRARDVQIYGLIGHQSVKTPLDDRCRAGAPNDAADAWIAEYVENFDVIVEHFQDRVEFFESFNEPNNWPKGWQTAWVHPYWFARMLRDIYQRVKVENKRKATLISGPILTHDIDGGDTGAPYINSTYQHGRSSHGWNEFRAQHGTFPLDGLGFHIYIEREPDTAGTDRAYRRRVDQVWNAFTRHEGADTPKRLFVSEFGWQSAQGEDHKARHIETALPLLRNDWRVRLAILFCMQGWDNKTWGIYRPFGLGEADREPAYEVFRAQAKLDKQEPGTIEQPVAAVPSFALEVEPPPERTTLRSRADVLALLELVANALLRGEMDVDTAELLKGICVTALDAL